MQIGDCQDPDLLDADGVHYGIRKATKQDPADDPVQQVPRLGELLNLSEGPFTSMKLLARRRGEHALLRSYCRTHGCRTNPIDNLDHRF